MYNPNEPRDEQGQWTSFEASGAILAAASGKSDAQDVVNKAKDIYKTAKETMTKLGIKNEEAAIIRASTELQKTLPHDIYFHGSNADFATIDINRGGDRDAGNWGRGFYVSKSPTVANAYGMAAVERNGGKIKLMIIKVDNSKIATMQQAHDILKDMGKSFPLTDKHDSIKFSDMMINRGFDGVGIGNDVVIFNSGKATKLKTLDGIKDLFQ